MQRGMRMGVTAAVLLLALPAWGQEGEVSGCAEACYEAEDHCLQACESSDDPAVCEDGCETATDGCLDRCEGGAAGGDRG